MEIRLKVQLSMVPTMAKAFIFDGEMEVYSGVVQLVYQFQWLHAELMMICFEFLGAKT